MDKLDEFECVAVKTLNSLGLLKSLDVYDYGYIAICKNGMIVAGAFDQEGAKSILSAMPKDNAEYMIKGKDLASLFIEENDSYEYTPCMQFVYKGDRFDLPQSYDIRRLDIGFLDFVSENYHLGSREYVAKRLESGAVYGIFVDGNIAGFIGTHTEGAMGMLEIMPSYRRRGLAETLEKYLINKILDSSLVPFCDVIVGNYASERLQQKIGLERTKDDMWWLWRKEEQ